MEDGKLWEAREELLVAALSYAASEKGDPTSPYYDAQLELHCDMLDAAAGKYLELLRG